MLTAPPDPAKAFYLAANVVQGRDQLSKNRALARIEALEAKAKSAQEKLAAVVSTRQEIGLKEKGKQ